VPLADSPPQPDSPAIQDKLDMQPTSPVPADITASTVDDFLSNANAKMGGTGAVGHMQAETDWKAEFDEKGHITKVNMVVKTTIVRPRWAGGHPKPSAQEEALIKKAVKMIKEHEEHHRKIAEDNMKEAFKQMHGKTEKQANKIFDDFTKKMDKEQKALDGKEGKLTPEHKGPAGAAGPATDVVAGPADP
jgi:predicted secreted Zn-dependent protease